MTDSTKTPVRLGWDVVMLLLVAGLVAMALAGGVQYLSDSICPDIHESFVQELELYLQMGLVMLAFTATVVIRLFWKWKTSPAWTGFARCGIIVLLCVGIAGVFRDLPSRRRLIQRCVAQMRTKADIKAIRAWARGVKVPTNSTIVENEPPNPWPECVKALRPRCVFSIPDVHGVDLVWGGGFLSPYGLVVGPEDLEVPKASPPEQIIPLEPGAYLYFR